MDTFLGLLTLAFVVYFVFWEDWLKPLLGLDKPRKSVKSLPSMPAYKRRSARSERSNATNAGSAQQKAKRDAANVPPNVPGSPPIAAAASVELHADGGYVLSANELQQLAEAVAARASGATIDEAMLKGFGLKKGGGKSYVRARELFDTATKAP